MKVQIKRTAILGMLIAMEIILSRFLSISTPTLKISFSFVILAVTGMLFGPIWAGLVGAMADLLGAILFPIGPYFFGFTITAFLTGLLFGIFFYRKPITLLRAILSSSIICIVLRIGLDTYWLYQIMGKGIFASVTGRVITNVIMIAVMTIFILILGYPVERFSKRLDADRVEALRTFSRRFYREHANWLPDISQSIAERCFALPQYDKAETVFCFVGKIGSEIDTTAILERVLRDGKRLCVPLSGDNRTMTAREIRSLAELSETGLYDVSEPKSDAPILQKEDIDIAFVPCSVTDKRHNRIGKGSGYYDFYLKDATFYKVGLCPILLVRYRLPVQKHDVPLDAIVTNAGVF